ncbi:MAG: TraM recognition domain-containing protein [Micrococcales bacterium]|nr:TraM recognition domain-containing protein [Micrococcales bacterium]
MLGLLDVPTTPLGQLRSPVMTTRRLTIRPRLGLLDTSRPETVAAGLLAALAGADRDGEELVLQVVLGPRLAPTSPPAITPEPSLWALVRGAPAAPDAKATAQKTSTSGFQAVVRLGVSAGTPSRRQALTLGVLGALHLMQTPSSRLGLVPEPPERLGAAQVVRVPRWRWPLRLNATEAVSLAALPVSKADDDLPGLPSAHPRLLPPSSSASSTEASDRVVVARATAPGAVGTLTRTTPALLRHTHVVGPTGTGKSVLLLNLTLQDIAAGRGAVVIEPKGDLVDDLLARIPEHRLADVVVLDPLADHVVGLNPLAGSGSPELRAGAVLSVFTSLFGDALGPRTTDVLHSCLLTLSRQPDASLVQIPRLLTDPVFRASKVAGVAGDVALGSFWTWYESLGESERASVIAPLMNKLRAVILRPSIRRVIGQSRPLFQIGQVFSEKKILLVPLPSATLGTDGASLLGSLLVSNLWDAVRARAKVKPELRTPVSVVVDEVQTFMSFSADLSDALATSRAYGAGWTLAHQYLGQLTPALRQATLANCRSRVVFQTNRDDAKVFAGTTTGKTTLTVEDFQSLPAFHVYASMFDQDSNQPFASGQTMPPPRAVRDPEQARHDQAARYGRAVADIEAEFAAPSLPASSTSNVGLTGSPEPVPDAALGRAPRQARQSQPANRPPAEVSDRSSDRVEMDSGVTAGQDGAGAIPPDASSPSTGDDQPNGGQP